MIINQWFIILIRTIPKKEKQTNEVFLAICRNNKNSNKQTRKQIIDSSTELKRQPSSPNDNFDYVHEKDKQSYTEFEISMKI